MKLEFKSRKSGHTVCAFNHYPKGSLTGQNPSIIRYIELRIEGSTDLSVWLFKFSDLKYAEIFGKGQANTC